MENTAAPKAFNNNYLYPIAALLFVVACLSYEHFNGGVVTHHLLADPSMPGFSNWYGLITLPALGAIFGARIAKQDGSAAMHWVFIAALLYAAIMAATYEFGALELTNLLFIGLFVIGLALPAYRIEYFFGFVVGMTFTFGGVLPLIIGSVIVAFSFVSRWLVSSVWHMVKRR